MHTHGTLPQEHADNEHTVALRQITDKAREFGAGPLFDKIFSPAHGAYP